MNEITTLLKIPAIAEAFLPHISAIYRRHPNGNQPQLIGTGVYLGIADRCFLLTAAHVLDVSARSTIYCVIGSNLVPIEARAAHQSKIPKDGTRKDDRIDIGVVDITEIVREHATAGMLLGVGDLDVADNGKGDFYVALGYPETKNRKVNMRNRSLRRRLLIFTNKLHPRQEVETLGYNPDINLLLDFEKKKTRTGTNKRTVAPDLTGMSGGALLRLDVDSRSTSYKLVGILIEWKRPGKVQGMLAVRIAIATEVVRNMQPDLSCLIPRATNLQINIIDGT